MFALLISILLLAMVVGGILFLRKSATRFNLTPTQLARIKQRNQTLEQQERANDDK